MELHRNTKKNIKYYFKTILNIQPGVAVCSITVLHSIKSWFWLFLDFLSSIPFCLVTLFHLKRYIPNLAGLKNLSQETPHRILHLAAWHLPGQHTVAWCGFTVTCLQPQFQNPSLVSSGGSWSLSGSTQFLQGPDHCRLYSILSSCIFSSSHVLTLRNSMSRVWSDLPCFSNWALPLCFSSLHSL